MRTMVRSLRSNVFIGASVVASLSFIFAGCAGLLAGNYLVTQGKGDVALVSFAINRQILGQGDTAKENKPTLAELEKMPKEYWAHYDASVASMYNQFKGQVSEALLDAPMLDPGKIEGNNAYLGLTAHQVKMLLGIDVGTGVNQISAPGLNYVSPHNKQIADSLCSLLGVNLLLSVENDAFYRIVDSVRKIYKVAAGEMTLLKTVPYNSDEVTRGIFPLFSSGIQNFYKLSDSMATALGLGKRDTIMIKKVMTGSIELTSAVYLVQKGFGLVWSRSYPWLRAKTLVEFDDSRAMKQSDFPAQLTEALQGVYPELKTDAERGKAFAESLDKKK